MLFPKWANRAPLYVLAGLTVLLVGGATAFIYVISPYSTQVGYAPHQPVPYSHKLHAGDLGMDCRYCHVGVFAGPAAVVPPTETCMNCHAVIRKDSEKLRPVRESYATGGPVEWIRIHRVPDFAYFNHSVHVNAGVGCETCHGRIDQMEVVAQAKPLNMAWCLDCHRAPEKYLRPVDQVTTMGYVPPGGDQLAHGLALKEAGGIAPTQNCSGCHR
jgi:hypothetical protein